MAYYATYQQDETGELQKVVINAGVGFVLPFYGETAPPGTLACDGSEISRATYDELFQVLGTKAGAGDGSTTFNLPDLRGDFIRGLGGENAGELGVEQGDAIRNITGSFWDYIYQQAAETPPHASGAFYKNTDFPSNQAVASVLNQPWITLNQTGDFCGFDASNVVPTAAENRPVNVALLWCIIYE